MCLFFCVWTAKAQLSSGTRALILGMCLLSVYEQRRFSYLLGHCHNTWYVPSICVWTAKAQISTGTRALILGVNLLSVYEQPTGTRAQILGMCLLSVYEQRRFSYQLGQVPQCLVCAFSLCMNSEVLAIYWDKMVYAFSLCMVSDGPAIYWDKSPNTWYVPSLCAWPTKAQLSTVTRALILGMCLLSVYEQRMLSYLLEQEPWYLVCAFFLFMNSEGSAIYWDKSPNAWFVPSLCVWTANAQLFTVTRALILCICLRLRSYSMCLSSEGSGETARTRRLARVFAAPPMR